MWCIKLLYTLLQSPDSLDALCRFWYRAVSLIEQTSMSSCITSISSSEQWRATSRKSYISSMNRYCISTAFSNILWRWEKMLLMKQQISLKQNIKLFIKSNVFIWILPSDQDQYFQCQPLWHLKAQGWQYSIFFLLSINPMCRPKPTMNTYCVFIKAWCIFFLWAIELHCPKTMKTHQWATLFTWWHVPSSPWTRTLWADF